MSGAGGTPGGPGFPPGRAYGRRVFGRRPRRGISRPELVGELLDRLLERRRFKGPMRIHRIRSAWWDMVGAMAAGRSNPASLEKGRLVVAVADSNWLQELTYLKQVILERVRAVVGEEAVTDVHFRVQPGAATPQDPGDHLDEEDQTDPEEELRKRPLAPEVASALSQLEDDLERVTDPDLRRAIRRAFIRHILRAP